ncbi:MAG TPA: hypothetical protein VGO43_10645, partial [Pyrinomonadaceae bacterium]|nr:hypothetical protein [Pyrinomonadaceae bacterium]
RYLATERSSKYYQEWEAAENAKLWEARQPTEDELDLFLHAYLVAKHIGAANAIPFRLNVMSRRGVIIFNDGYVNCPKIKSQCSRTTFTQLKSP